MHIIHEAYPVEVDGDNNPQGLQATLVPVAGAGYVQSFPSEALKSSATLLQIRCIHLKPTEGI